MFFRFGSAIFLVVAISLVGIAIEKQNLHQRRELSRQTYQMDVLRDEHTRLRLHCQQLASIERLFETVERKNAELTAPKELAPVAPAEDSEKPSEPETQRRVPLLFFQEPLRYPRTNERPD